MRGSGNFRRKGGKGVFEQVCVPFNAEWRRQKG